VEQPTAVQVTATTLSTTSIKIDWTASVNHTAYHVRFGTSGQVFTTAATVSATVQTYTFTGLTPSTAYQFDVLAANESYQISSNAASATTLTPVPPAVQVSASGTTDTTINLSWTASQDHTNYEVYRAIGNGDFSSIAVVSAATRTQAVTGLTPNTAYRFKVTAFNSQHRTDSTIISETTFMSTPTAVSVTATVPGHTRIDLNWTASQNHTGYEIFSAIGDGAFSSIGSVSAGVQAQSVTGLTANTRYRFKVTAFNPQRRTDSAIISATTLVTPPTAVVVSPSVVSHNRIDLSWTASANATGFDVYRALGDNGFTLIQSVPATIRSQSMTSLNQNTRYRFKVTATNIHHQVESNIASATTPWAPTTPPRNLRARAKSQTSVVVTWDAGTNVNEYHVYHHDGQTWRFVQSVGAQTLSTEVAGLTPGKHRFSAWSVNPSGQNTSSNVDKVNTKQRARVDFDGDGKSDYAVFRPTESRFLVKLSGGGVINRAHGGVGDVAVPADYDGDGKTDIAVYRRGNGTWYILPSSTFPNGGYAVAHGDNDFRDVPVPADYDGDGRDDIAVFRPTDGRYYIKQSTDGDRIESIGAANAHIPVPADYDGDGNADVAVYRPGNATWTILGSKRGRYEEVFGQANLDMPVPADHDADGTTDLVVFRHAGTTGNYSEFYIIYSKTRTGQRLDFGARSLDLPISGDFNGDGTDDVTVFRRDNGNESFSQFFTLLSGVGGTSLNFGAANLDKPLGLPVYHGRTSPLLPSLSNWLQP